MYLYNTTENRMERSAKDREGNVLYDVVKDRPPVEMKLTQNQLYGVRSTGDSISMETNVLYDVAKDKSGKGNGNETYDTIN